MIKALDELGRVVIPKMIRKELNLKEGMLLEIKKSGQYIVIGKSDSYICKECGQLVDKIDVFCRNCGKKLK